MDSSLHEVWQAASGSPFVPTVGKGSQFFVAFTLLLLGFALSGAFALSMFGEFLPGTSAAKHHAIQIDLS
jgi:hypothetical protein